MFYKINEFKLKFDKGVYDENTNFVNIKSKLSIK